MADITVNLIYILKSTSTLGKGISLLLIFLTVKVDFTKHN